MILLSEFLSTIICNYKWFRISAKSKEGYVEFLTSEIIMFYNNVFIEKLLANNFLYIDITISYKFNSKTKLDRELTSNTMSCLVELYNSPENRVFAKHAVACLHTRNMWLERKISNYSKENNNCIKLICLEDYIYNINKINNRKPFKISIDRFERHCDNKYININKDYTRNGFCVSNCFNLKQQYSIKINIRYFNKNTVSIHDTILSLDDIENYLESVSEQLGKINLIFTKDKNTRNLNSFLKKISLTVKDIHTSNINKMDHFLIEICPIKLFATKYNSESNSKSDIDIDYYYKLLDVVHILKKQYDTINNDHLKSFWDLLHTIAKIFDNEKYRNYEKYNHNRDEFFKIFPNSIYGRVVAKVITINDIKLNLFFNMRKNESLKMVHYLYSEKIKSQLEKFLMTMEM